MQFFMYAKRVLAIGAVVTALYVVIGCCIFSQWWYSWVFEGDFKDWGNTLDAFGTLLDYYFGLVLFLLAAVLVLGLAGNFWRAYLFRVVDRFGGVISFSSVWLIALAFAIVYHVHHRTVPSVGSRFEQVNLLVSSQIQALTSLPVVRPPIDFHYIDTNRVDALYSQLEPELVEKQRTVADTSSGQAKVEVTGGPASIEAGLEKGKNSTSSYSRTDFSAERKCIVIMQYVTDNGRSTYFTNGARWIEQSVAIQAVLRQQQKLLADVFKRESPDLHTVPNQASLEEEVQKSKDRKNALDALKSTLDELKGLVFLDTDFNPSSEGSGPGLVAEFLMAPKGVLFRVSVPESFRVQIQGRTRLTVFGDVTRSLTSDGIVEFRAIAVY